MLKIRPRNLTLGLCVALGVTALVHGLTHAGDSSPDGLLACRPLSDAELARFTGADGPGSGGAKECVLSAANCSNIVPCPSQGAYACTTCMAGPGSEICQNAETPECEATEVVNCPDGQAGTCFDGVCVPNGTPVQCGVYYNYV